MSLRLRQLELRVQTSEGLFGTRIRFSDGLVLLRAENNMGKSTCIQGIIYALGLDKMLGPSGAIPLPHAMTKYVEDGIRELPVLESEVLIEIENHKGEFLTIQRGVVGQRDTRLVSTWDGPRLSNPSTSSPQRDYFVRDPGSAQHEAGYSRRLAEFIGWQLPTVQRFNGSECPLYLEAIFPLFLVEQKHGWAGIQANLPTFLGIREMAKRSVEFVLNLDAARLAEERQKLEQEEADLRNRWRNLTNLLISSLRQVNGRVIGLPEQPSAQWPPAIAPIIEIFRGNVWTAAESAIVTDKQELSRLEQAPVPTAGEAAATAAVRLEVARQELAQRELLAGELLDNLQREQVQLEATETRLGSLREDLRRNKDALKLRSFGSTVGWHLIEHTCPTCQQRIADTLLLQGPLEHPMSIEENIIFIENQLKTFEHLRENTTALIARKEAELATFRAEMDSLRAEIRTLRQTLLAPTSTPSIEDVRRRVELDTRIRLLERVISEFDQAMESFGETATEWRSMLDRRKALPTNGFSHIDKVKLGRLQSLLREQLKEFGFSSLNPDTLEISQQTYRPTREGFDLGFDLSASDNIRTIWAYLQALLELAHEQPTNHLGLLVFDEPRQQEAAELSFERLLRRAARAKDRHQQIVFATSEPLANIQRMTAGLGPQIVTFEGRAISKLA